MMQNKANLRLKTIIMALIFLLAFGGCAAAKKIQSPQTNTSSGLPQASALSIENAGMSKKDGASSVFILSGGKTFSGSVSETCEDIPIAELNDTLASFGIDPALSPQYFSTDPAGRFYYSIDLSFAEPVCYTTAGELVCKLKGSAETAMMIVLDSATPSKARFYLAPTWDISCQEASFQLDGIPVTKEEEAHCKEMLQIHAHGMNCPGAAILDGNMTKKAITVLPTLYPGLSYTFFEFEYVGYSEPVVYSVQDDSMVFARGTE